MNNKFDINADVGEGLGNEADLMPYLDSCSIACGGHAGDESTMKNVVQLADRYKVKIGAHPSFPDKENFGRKPMDISSADLFGSLKEQIRMLLSIMRESRSRLNHIKPHGALYNMAVYDERTAKVIIEAVKSFSNPLKLYVPYGSIIARIAEAEKMPIVYEAFADRNYNEDLSLVSRSGKKAIIENEVDILTHLQRMIEENKVKTIGGKLVKIKAETFCVHGDNPNAKNILKFLSENLRKSAHKTS